MAEQTKSQRVYTVKTLKDVLVKAKAWESNEDDFVGICECIEGILNGETSLENIKTYFKRLNKICQKVSISTEYKQTKTHLCNPSYLLKHRPLQLSALVDVGYDSGTGCSLALTGETTPVYNPSPELIGSQQSLPMVAVMIEKLTNELEVERRRRAILEDEQRENSITLQAVLNQTTEIETSLSTAWKGEKKTFKHKEDNVPSAPISTISAAVMDSLKRCVGHIETLKNESMMRERERTRLTNNAKELRDKVLPVSKMIDTFNSQWNEVKNTAIKKKKNKGKSKKPVPPSQAFQFCTEMSASDIIKCTSQTLSDMTSIFPRLQELMECLKAVRDMESWISAAGHAAKSGTVLQSQPVSSGATEDSLLSIPDKIRGHVEGFCKDYLGQLEEVSNLREDVERLKHEREEIDVAHQKIEQDHAKYAQGMGVLSQLKQKMEDATAITQEKENLLQTYMKDIHQLKNDIANREEAIQHVRQEKETLSERFETDILSKEAEILKLKARISVRDKDIEDLKNQNDKLLNRISKQAELRLTDGNHGITDLSDPNRPTNLAEQFSELYDNEWTEAFEEVMENKQKEKAIMKDKDAISFLLSILCVTNDYCRRQADTQWNDILGAVCQQSKDQLPQISPICTKDLRNVRKLTCNISAEGVTKRFLDTELSCLNLKPEEIGDNLEIYTRKCVELCWLMSTQNPPLALYKEVQSNDHFDQDYFKSYTCSGTTVEFLVWPALLCQENGDLLRKGVCQGLKKK